MSKMIKNEIVNCESSINDKEILVENINHEYQHREVIHLPEDSRIENEDEQYEESLKLFDDTLNEETISRIRLPHQNSKESANKLSEDFLQEPSVADDNQNRNIHRPHEDLSLEIESSLHEEAKTDNNNTGNNYSSDPKMLIDNVNQRNLSFIQVVEENSNESEIEFGDEFRIGLITNADDQNINLSISLENNMSLELKESPQKQVVTDNNANDNNDLHLNKRFSKNVNEGNINTIQVLPDNRIDPENETEDNFLIESLFNPDEQGVSYPTTPHEEDSNNDLNIRDAEILNDNLDQENLTTFPIIADNYEKLELKNSDGFQLGSPINLDDQFINSPATSQNIGGLPPNQSSVYNNDYDPDIPGSEISMKMLNQENFNSIKQPINSDNEKHTGNDVGVEKVTHPAGEPLEIYNSSEINKEMVNKKNENNISELQGINSRQQQDHSKVKHPHRSLLTRALDNTAENEAHRSKMKQSQGMELKASEPLLQNLTPFAKSVCNAPCSMAATISGLIFSKLKNN